MTTISQELATELIQQMRTIHASTGRQPGEFTAKEYGVANGMKYDPAASELERLEDAGIVTRRKVNQSVYFRFST